MSTNNPVTTLVSRSARTWPADVVPVLVLELLVVSEVFVGDGVPISAVLLSQILIAPLLLRRRYPRLVFAVVAVLAVAQESFFDPSSGRVGILIALYTVAAYRDRRDAYIAAGVLDAGVLYVALTTGGTAADALTSYILLTGMVAAALFLGTTLRTRRQYLQSLEERAAQLERERDQQSLLAATAERTRIAREMHDIVAHSLSVVVTLADGAVASQTKNPEQAMQAMQQVAATGRQSLSEMRRLLGILRQEEGSERAPQPGLGGIEALLDDVRSTGKKVSLVIRGEPRELSETAAATVYRIIQEGTTNVLKHAEAAQEIEVSVEWSDDDLLRVEIADDGIGATTTNPGGHGLQGVRERAALYDGRVTTGKSRLGGWLLSAELHIGEHV